MQSENIPIEPEQVMLLRKIDFKGLRYISFLISFYFNNYVARYRNDLIL